MSETHQRHRKYTYAYEVPRSLVDTPEWNELCEKTHSSTYMYTDIAKFQNDHGGYENGTFRFMPYDWSVEADESAPNFLYKPSGFAITWYKYPFRGAFMTHDYDERRLRQVFKSCAQSVEEIDDDGDESL